jgi:hypothetical protein
MDRRLPGATDRWLPRRPVFERRRRPDGHISIHLHPRETSATLDALENRIEDLEADVEYLDERRRAGARGVEKDLRDYEALYDALRNTSMTALDVSVYLTTRGPSEARLDGGQAASEAKRSPANLTPVLPRWSQLDALVSGSPVGLDRLGRSMDTTTPMLSGSVGAMFPFVSGSVAEPGVEYGTYAVNGSPVVLDRFERETGYCMLVVGMLGSGKSVSTKLHLLRRAMYDPDTTIVMLDPLSGFAEVTEMLGGERVTVGGTRPVNPLEIRPVPENVLAATPDLDPWAEQITWVMTFFETFFEQVAGNALGDRKQTLRRAVQETYERAGITRDPATHAADSPTIPDLVAVLEDLLADPGRFGYATAPEREAVGEDARELLTDLRPSFCPDGDLQNLAQHTGFDTDADVLYLDLNQEEGAGGRGDTHLMMQVLFKTVYERAKATSDRVLFAIDEAHYLLGDEASATFLETAVRHSRHYDLSLQFITQTGGEFTLTPEARTIADLCSMTLVHRATEHADTLADWFGLNERQLEWVRTATAGNETDEYAEALLGVEEEGWFPLRVRASDAELDALDGD